MRELIPAFRASSSIGAERERAGLYGGLSPVATLALVARDATGLPRIEQLIVTRLIPRMDEILELRRGQLRAGRDRLEELVARHLPEWEVPHVDGGIVTWVGLGAPVSSQLALAARREGLIVAAGPRFGIDGAFERFLRLPVCYSPETTDAAVPRPEPGQLPYELIVRGSTARFQG